VTLRSDASKIWGPPKGERCESATVAVGCPLKEVVENPGKSSGGGGRIPMPSQHIQLIALRLDQRPESNLSARLGRHFFGGGKEGPANTSSAKGATFTPRQQGVGTPTNLSEGRGVHFERRRYKIQRTYSKKHARGVDQEGNKRNDVGVEIKKSQTPAKDFRA